MTVKITAIIVMAVFYAAYLGKRFCAEVFGKEYEDYCRRVRRYL